MADDTTLPVGAGGDTIHTKDFAGVKTQVIILAKSDNTLIVDPTAVTATQAGAWNVTLLGGAATVGKVDQGTGGASAWKVDGSAVTQPVSGTFWQATQPVSGTFWQATQPVSGPLTDVQLRAVPVPVSGTVTATQGTAAALAGAWPVKVTDGTNSMPTLDTVDRSGFVQITDGTRSGTVKAANTPAAVGDTSVTVALHPSSPLPAGSSTIGAVDVTDRAARLVGVVYGSAAMPLRQDAMGDLYLAVDGTPGTTAPVVAAAIGGVDAGGLLRTLLTDAAGRTQIADQDSQTVIALLRGLLVEAIEIRKAVGVFLGRAITTVNDN